MGGEPVNNSGGGVDLQAKVYVVEGVVRQRIDVVAITLDCKFEYLGRKCLSG